MKTTPKIITGNAIQITGSIPRHEIVRKVVNTFIDTEHNQKGKGIIFKYPVENLPNGQQLFIVRPGHKKNFDFKVEVTPNLGLGSGSHVEIANDLKIKRQENPQKFEELFDAIIQIYDCSENDVNKLLLNYPNLNNSFQTGARVEIILKVVKWLFIMEDIIYWDTEGRAFLFNFFLYVSNESDNKRLKEALEKLDKINNPSILKNFMKKANITWRPCR
jgi:hypothetical protein